MKTCLLEAYPVRTITFDNGTEFSAHHAIAEQLNAKVYFARAKAPWQRGLNENTNGLLRQYLYGMTVYSRRRLEALVYSCSIDIFRKVAHLPFHLVTPALLSSGRGTAPPRKDQHEIASRKDIRFVAKNRKLNHANQKRHLCPICPGYIFAGPLFCIRSAARSEYPACVGLGVTLAGYKYEEPSVAVTLKGYKNCPGSLRIATQVMIGYTGDARYEIGNTDYSALEPSAATRIGITNCATVGRDFDRQLSRIRR